MPPHPFGPRIHGPVNSVCRSVRASGRYQVDPALAGHHFASQVRGIVRSPRPWGNVAEHTTLHHNRHISRHATPLQNACIDQSRLRLLPSRRQQHGDARGHLRRRHSPARVAQHILRHVRRNTRRQLPRRRPSSEYRKLDNQRLLFLVKPACHFILVDVEWQLSAQ